jgi:hypothetical protein
MGGKAFHRASLATHLPLEHKVKEITGGRSPSAKLTDNLIQEYITGTEESIRHLPHPTMKFLLQSIEKHW